MGPQGGNSLWTSTSWPSRFRAGRAGSKARKATVTRSNRVECAGKASAEGAGTVASSVHLDRNLPPNLNDLITGKAKEIADMDSVALHDGEELLPVSYTHLRAHETDSY